MQYSNKKEWTNAYRQRQVENWLDQYSSEYIIEKMKEANGGKL